MSVVKFKKDVTQAEYDALEPKDASTLYFIVDTKTICLGEEIYGSHIEISDVDGNIIELTEDGLFAGLNVALDIGPENTDEEVPSAAATYEALVSVAPLWVGEPLPEGFFDGQIVDMPTLKNALSELSPVTGVKGAEEADFRTGEVELSPANLGAEAASNKTVSLSAESTDSQYPTAKAVYDAVESKVDKSGTDRLMTAEEGTKLSGIATGAQVNPTIATEAEAKTGTDNAKMMTPLVSKKAVDAAIAIKADKNNTLQSSLYASNARTLGNPAVSVTYDNIFANPPLPDMGAIQYAYIQFPSSSAAEEMKSPIADATAICFNILTMASNPNRAAQLAIESFRGPHEGEIYVRSRHVDNDNFSEWQDWKKVVLYQKLAKTTFPVATGIVARQTSYISKDMFGLITVVATLGKSSGNFGNVELLGTLPAGYLPAETIIAPAIMFEDYNNPAPTHICGVSINTSGQLHCHGSGYACISFNMSFVLA